MTKEVSQYSFDVLFESSACLEDEMFESSRCLEYNNGMLKDISQKKQIYCNNSFYL